GSPPRRARSRRSAPSPARGCSRQTRRGAGGRGGAGGGGPAPAGWGARRGKPQRRRGRRPPPTRAGGRTGGRGAEACSARGAPHAREGKIVRPGYDARLDELHAIQKDGAERVAALEAELRAQTGAPSLRIKYNNVFGYYIEVTKTHLAKVPPAWRRKQTIAGGGRDTNAPSDDLAGNSRGAR